MSGRGVCIYPDSPEQARQLMAQWSPTHAVAVFPRPGAGIGRPEGCRLFRPRPRVGDYRAAAEAALRVACPGVRSVEHYPAPVPVDTSVRRVESIGDLEGGLGKEVGFVAVHFNPCGYRVPRENFRRFLKRFEWLQDRLLVVELAYGKQGFHLTGQAKNLLQLRSDSVMWHKENLINIGTRILRDRGFKNVGWLDGDSILAMDGEEWLRQIEKQLRSKNLVQVFETIDLQFDNFSRTKSGAVADYFGNKKPAWDCHCGGWGWVVKGRIWDECGWYPLGIAGSGDRLMFVGSLPGVDDLHRHAEMWGGGNAHLPVYRAWVEKWRALIKGRVGYLPGVHVGCEPHGNSVGRAYRERADGLVRLGFDPLRDVTVDANGVLAWTPEAPPELQKFVIDYFQGRKEDG